MPIYIRQWMFSLAPVLTTISLISYASPIFLAIVAVVIILFILLQVGVYALRTLCEGNPPVTGRFPSQRTNNAELWRLLWCQLEQAVKQTLKSPVWDDMSVMWHLCNECDVLWFLTVLTHWGQDKMAFILQTIIWNLFSWINTWISNKNYWSMFQRV